MWHLARQSRRCEANAVAALGNQRSRALHVWGDGLGSAGNNAAIRRGLDLASGASGARKATLGSERGAQLSTRRSSGRQPRRVGPNDLTCGKGANARERGCVAMCGNNWQQTAQQRATTGVRPERRGFHRNCGGLTLWIPCRATHPIGSAIRCG